jgi:hypothetical protein
MEWHVQFRNGDSDRIARYATPEAALEAACRLIDGGAEVYGIGTGPLGDSIGAQEIAKVYAMWAAFRPRAGWLMSRDSLEAP